MNLKPGTSVFYRPGVIIGGKIHHDCPVSRSIGYFLEPLIGLAPFAKIPFQITMTGVTNDNVDVSVCFTAILVPSVVSLIYRIRSIPFAQYYSLS